MLLTYYTHDRRLNSDLVHPLAHTLLSAWVLNAVLSSLGSSKLESNLLISTWGLLLGYVWLAVARCKTSLSVGARECFGWINKFLPIHDDICLALHYIKGSAEEEVKAWYMTDRLVHRPLGMRRVLLHSDLGLERRILSMRASTLEQVIIYLCLVCV